MPKIVDKDAKRKEILRAAMRVFAEKGVTETKMADVARAAGIGKGTIYEYFQSREQLFQSAFEYLLRKIKAMMVSQIDESLSPPEKIRTGFLAYLDVTTMQIEDFAEILLDFWAYAIRNKDNADNITLDIRNRYQEFRDLTIPILEEGIQKGIFKPHNTEFVASAIIAAGDGLLLQWMADKHHFDLKATAETILNIILEGITNHSNDD
ncbi:MAG: TetR/AcrR family transcriptional regulator [Calditrichaeota bacterium]|nr:TetR/AcrR family transcriptional regulator [Calditrichota bacterium]